MGKMSIKLGIIGLDTSHSIAFSNLIHGDDKRDDLRDLQISACMRFPSVFNSEESQDEREAQLEKWGIKVTRNFEEAVEGVDGILLEINDPALHLEYFTKAAELGKPIFLDKPLAGNIEDGRKILRIAEEKNVRVWSSSSLRFTNEITKAVESTDEPVLCNVFGPMGQAAAGSSLIWYGVHSFEMLNTIMGKGAESVLAQEDKHGIVTIVSYSDERRGIVECNRDSRFYGGRVQDTKQLVPFNVDSSAGLYYNLLVKIKNFFVMGEIPVSLTDTYEILAMMVAAEQSVKSGKAEKVISCR